MPNPLDGLTSAQREAVTHRDGPLLVAGGAGSGKTTVLAERFAWLVQRGDAPESILALSAGARAADALRRRIEPAIAGSYEELPICTLRDFCVRLLRDEALSAGLDPFAVAVSRGDRVAMLLERVDELPLRNHDALGRPAALLGAVVERIDRLKAEGAGPAELAARAAALPDDDPAAPRERELADLYRAHDAMLRAAGALDDGDLVLESDRLLRDDAAVRERASARLRHLLIDDLHELDPAPRRLVAALADGAASAVATVDERRALRGALPGARELTLNGSRRCPPAILRAAIAVLEAHDGDSAHDDETQAAAPADEVSGATPHGEAAPERRGGAVEFWRCDGERAQAQALAADVERLVLREGVAPERIAVLVRSLRDDAQPVALALEERAVAHRIVGAAAFFQRAEVRDVLAWLRLLVDPADAAAAVRALARAPIELRPVELARCVQIARRRKLDMVAALVAATESPQVPPEARERILQFLKLHRSATDALDTTRPDLFVHRLIERLGLRRQQLFAAQPDVVQRLVNLARFGEMAADYAQREPRATAREFARWIASVAETGLREEEAPAAGTPAGVALLTMQAARGMEWDHVYVVGLHAGRMPGARSARSGANGAPGAACADSGGGREPSMRDELHLAMTRARQRLVLAYPASNERGAVRTPSPFAERARVALGARWEDRDEELFGPAESLHAAFQAARDALLETIGSTGSRLGELRFDTGLDVSHAVVRYLELLKLAALIERPEGQPIQDALAEINSRLGQAVTSVQRETLLSSPLDDELLAAAHDDRRRAQTVAAHSEPSLEAFLPRRGDGLALSATDIDTYRICPLRYKFARVFRIPTEPTLEQRFGILVHQVLERFHAGAREQGAAELRGLLDAGWRRGGFGDSERERQLYARARDALARYAERFASEGCEPVWFERAFSFSIGPHVLRGRVDRVDRLPAGGYELIDYKTGRAKTASQLVDDVQLPLYAIAAREAWDVEATQSSYYYVLDDTKVPVPSGGLDAGALEETVLEVAGGILAQGFEPTPSYSACSTCDFRIACPAAER